MTVFLNFIFEFERNGWMVSDDIVLLHACFGLIVLGMSITDLILVEFYLKMKFSLFITTLLILLIMLITATCHLSIFPY